MVEDPNHVPTPESTQTTPDVVLAPVEQPPPPDPKQTDTFLANKAAREAATLIIEQIRESCTEANHPNFSKRLWELLRDEALQEIGMPPKSAGIKVRPMGDKAAKEFAKDEFPWGAHVEELVGAVYDKDPEYVREFSRKLNWWQIDLQAWVAWREKQTPQETKPKKETKPKPPAAKKETPKDAPKAAPKKKEKKK